MGQGHLWQRPRRAGRLNNLGKFMLGVTLRAVAPFVDPNVELGLEARDNGSGKLIAYYSALGLERKDAEVARRKDSGRMVARMAKVLDKCSSDLADKVNGGTGASPGVYGAAVDAGPGSLLGAFEGACPVCRESIANAAPQELALCGACAQPTHGVCMRAAAARDSRCPLCRAELSSVGYAVGGIISRPPRRRPRGGDLAAFATRFSDIHTTIVAFRALVNGVRSTCARMGTLRRSRDAAAIIETMQREIQDMRSHAQYAQALLNFTEPGAGGQVESEADLHVEAELPRWRACLGEVMNDALDTLDDLDAFCAQMGRARRRIRTGAGPAMPAQASAPRPAKKQRVAPPS